MVKGEEDLLVSCPTSAPYIEAAEESLETAFQALELVGPALEEHTSMQPGLSNAAMMVDKIMQENGYVPSRGLGRDGRGSAQLLELKENRGRFSLGYKPTDDDEKRLAAERREKNMARMQGREPKSGGI